MQKLVKELILKLLYRSSVCTHSMMVIKNNIYKHTLLIFKGEKYPDILEKVKFSTITWTHDNRGIFYGQYRDQQGKTDGSETSSNRNHKLSYHIVGTSQADDVVAVEFPEEPLLRM